MEAHPNRIVNHGIVVTNINAPFDKLNNATMYIPTFYKEKNTYQLSILL